MDSLERNSNQTLEPQSSGALKVQDWGLIDYQDALQRQLDLVDLVHQELARETIIFCSHPPVVTTGRATREGDVFAWSGATVEVNRGGRATYHGPNQVVAYPILDLNQRGRDLHKYMRSLEDAIVLSLRDFGIQAVGRSMQASDEGNEMTEATGVWVGSRKIASIGIGVRKWVSFHGLALNVNQDAQAFHGMKPCGFTAETMISMQEILGTRVDQVAVQNKLQQHLLSILK